MSSIDSIFSSDSIELDFFALNSGRRLQLAQQIDQYLERGYQLWDQDKNQIQRLNQALTDSQTLEQFRVNQAVQQLKSLYLSSLSYNDSLQHYRKSNSQPNLTKSGYNTDEILTQIIRDKIDHSFYLNQNRPKSSYGRRESCESDSTYILQRRNSSNNVAVSHDSFSYQKRLFSSNYQPILNQLVHSKESDFFQHLLKTISKASPQIAIVRPQRPPFKHLTSTKNFNQTPSLSSILKSNKTTVQHSGSANKFNRIELTLRFLGFKKKLTVQSAREISIFQQTHKSGYSQLQFRNHIVPGQSFVIPLKPYELNNFSLNLFVDGVRDFRLNACCAYRHRARSRIGHFQVIKIFGGLPCDSCVNVLSNLEKQLNLRLNTFERNNRADRLEFPVQAKRKEKTIEDLEADQILGSSEVDVVSSSLVDLNQIQKELSSISKQPTIQLKSDSKDDDEPHSLNEFEQIEQELKLGRNYEELKQEFELSNHNRLHKERDEDEFGSYESEVEDDNLEHKLENDIISFKKESDTINETGNDVEQTKPMLV